MRITRCGVCGARIGPRVKTCPHCGAERKHGGEGTRKDPAGDRDGNAPRAAITFSENAKKAINTLYGIGMGIVADGEVNEREILFLDTWLRDNRDFLDRWPMSVVARRVGDILADGQISQEELEDFHAMLSALVGGAMEETGAAGGMATRLPVDAVEIIEFAGRRFCFTGKFLFGSRSRCEFATHLKGGEAVDNVVKTLDYLVIGALASRDWAHTSHGRKIEKALEHKEAGAPVRIVSEEVWGKYV